MSDRLGIDVWEVIDAAATKPFGFMPFYPGPGLGGHCIPIDPFYLSWKAKESGFEARFIELAGVINAGMPYHVVSKVVDCLNDYGKPVRGSRVLVLGAAYKQDIDDVREAPALDIMRLLAEKGAVVSYSDPYIAELHDYGFSLSSVELTQEYLRSVDCVVITTAHSSVDYGMVVDSGTPVVDTRNALKGYSGRQIRKL
jgi:UDP-N-acetyl-D-glucosamine dehydrogenase